MYSLVEYMFVFSLPSRSLSNSALPVASLSVKRNCLKQDSVIHSIQHCTAFYSLGCQNGCVLFTSSERTVVHVTCNCKSFNYISSVGLSTHDYEQRKGFHKSYFNLSFSKISQSNCNAAHYLQLHTYVSYTRKLLTDQIHTYV